MKIGEPHAAHHGRRPRLISDLEQVQSGNQCHLRLSSLSQQNHSHLRESPFPQSKRFDPEESLSRLLAVSFSMTYTNAVAWHTTCKSVL